MAEKEDQKHRARAENARSVTASGFPFELWKIWEANCEEHFSDCRWIKMWSDHVRAKNADKLEEMSNKIVELEMLIRNKPEEKKENVVETMGGKVPNGGD